MRQRIQNRNFQHTLLGLIAAGFASLTIYWALSDKNLAIGSFLLISIFCSPQYAIIWCLIPICSVYSGAYLGTSMNTVIYAGLLILTLVSWFFGKLLHPRFSYQAKKKQTLLRGAIRLFLLLGAVYFLFLISRKSISLLYASTFLTLFLGLYLSTRSPQIIRTCLRPGNFSVLLIATTLSLLFLEGSARLFIPDSIANTSTDWVKPDSQYIYTTRPNSHMPHPYVINAKRELAYFDVKISSQGFRDFEIPEKTAGEYRILALGDSFTFGAGMEQDRAYPKILQEMLGERKTKQNITVINGGVYGYGTWQEYGFLLDRGLAMKPDMVLLQTFTTNDIPDNILREGGWLRSYDAEHLRKLVQLKYLNLWQVHFEYWVASHFKTYRILRDSSRSNFDLIFFLENTRWLPIDKVPTIPPPEDRPFIFEPYLEEWYTELDQAWSIMQEELNNICETCKKEGIRLIAFDIPARFTVCNSAWRKNDKLITNSKYNQKRCLDLIKGFFEENEWDYINIWDTFKDYSDPCSLYIPYDGHLTLEGNQLLSSLIEEHLISGDYFKVTSGASY